MRVIGLTGGIATGKSTVSALLRERGVALIDADRVARDVVGPDTAGLAEVAARFPEVVSGGVLDRARLGARVFANAEERRALNAILHPRIGARVLELCEAYKAAGEKIVIYDAALLIENGLQSSVDGVILVTAPPEVQRARLLARDGFTPAEADARIAAQLPLAQKLPHATWVVNNGGDLADTRAQVDQIWSSIRALE